MKAKLVGAFAISAAVITTIGTTADFSAQADVATGLYAGVNQLRQSCGAVRQDPRLTAAAQRHANDMLTNSNFSHVGSDGSSPGARMAAAGFSQATATGEIVFWATGSSATADAALGFWMGSPGHRAIILNCEFAAAGFATASNGTMMTAVGDFASP
ncbi:CAP domain-containing protein [Mycolicibacterium sp. BiH015]|uniref:CAP domain-containing protein n=1 Tax=Mycolicibacterium sp. BiH015 TaxID=3018808 RepID=UPI0022E0EB63|nr:CAP domain-containing protein [Mycolicibacterium sp. BiH015]MDA2889762.1 CAP domain-containing protein [Mycolicibacterium sp. BiH015]